ncbi:DNA/RNA nuclease SfsA [Halomonas binhaiensis]|uniref:Sugar fermentation stimulation protein homolog n=1 Tax=Halomonas binhaiensis TaxID=2562282 RepID=A0A5C1NLF4_9GAMM|nr:DNA/RNA nuclease SfsA [Halomonas binhaiensis]QEM83551.1 DNA/RNA nuclease SfsA [Halomonas binhaiensis]
MDYPELYSGVLLKRYKRFLADIRLDDGREVVAHCPNTGSMRAVNVPGSRVWLSSSEDPKRKLKWTWELIELEQPGGGMALASVHTGRANRIVEEALRGAQVPDALADYSRLKREAKVEGARLDFRLDDDRLGSCFVEVKQVTLREQDGHGYFPDAVSERGRKHLEALAALAAQGHRAVLLFLVAHEAIPDVAPAAHLDPAYAETLLRVAGQGVEIMAFGIRVECSEDRQPRAIVLGQALPVRLT